MKGDGKGGDFSGKIIKKIVHSEAILEDLQSSISDGFIPFINILKSIASVHNLCRAAVLSPDFDEILNEFTISAEECSSKFGLSKTLKMHIISDHVVDFLAEQENSSNCF